MRAEDAEKKTRTYRVSTDVVPIVNPGLYWTGIGQRIAEGRFEEAKGTVCRVTVESIEGAFEGAPFAISAPSFSSPTEYNHCDDRVDFDLTVEEGFVEDFVRKLEAEEGFADRFEGFLQESHGPRPGFIDFSPSTVEQWKAAIRSTGDAPRWRYSDAALAICEAVVFTVKQSVSLDAVEERFYETLEEALQEEGLLEDDEREP